MKSMPFQPISIRGDRFFVITGGPGSGKTTLIGALRAAGHACAPEAGRAVIQEEMAAGGKALPWADRTTFAARMLERDLKSHVEAAGRVDITFFDRGIPDIVGYLTLSGLPVPEALDRAARERRYNRNVFIAPPWREIFRQDRERRQDFEEAVRTCEVMIDTYGRYGYVLIELPLATVEERVRFVLERTLA